MANGKIYSIQVGYGRSGYRPFANYVGSYKKALEAYNNFHLHQGMKKRLIIVGDDTILQRDISKK